MFELSKLKNNWFSFLLVSLYIYSVFLFSYTEGRTIISKVLGVVILLYFVIQVASGRIKVSFRPEFLLLFLWLFFALVSAVFAENTTLALNKVITLLQVFGLSFVLFHLFVYLKNIDLFLVVFVTGALFSYVISVGDPGAYTEEGRFHATFGNSNLYALVSLVSLLSALNFIWAGKGLTAKIFGLVTLPCLFYIILQTGSRKALLGMFIVVFIYAALKFFFYLKHDPKKSVYTVVMGFVMLLLGGIFLVNSAHYDRIDRIIRAVETGDKKEAGISELGRLQLYQKGFEVALENPVFGVGLDNLREVSVNNLGGKIGTYSHSNYIEIMVSTGFIGFFIYFSIYFYSSIRYIQLRKRLISHRRSEIKYLHLCISLLALFVIYDFAMVSYYEKVSWLILTFLLAAPYTILKIYLDNSALERKVNETRFS